MTGYRQRAFDLAQRLDSGEATAAEAAAFLRSEIVIGPKAAGVLRMVIEGREPISSERREAFAEIHNIDDIVPF